MAHSSKEEDIAYSVRLVAATGKEQAVLLRIRRDGLWLYTQGGKEIQQLPYHHIVKWLPSKLRSKHPGPEDCLDVQVETTTGKKDLRMRCADVPTVQAVINDIRTTVQGIMAELGSRPAGAPAAAQQATASPQQQQQLEPGSDTQQWQGPNNPQQLAVARQQLQQQQQFQEQQQQQIERTLLQERQVQQQVGPNTAVQLHEQEVVKQAPLDQQQQALQQQRHQQTAAVLEAAQQQLRSLLQQQLQQSKRAQAYQQQQQQLGQAAVQVSPARAAAAGVRSSVDTLGIAGSSGSPRAGSRSPLRHSFPKAAAGSGAFAHAALSPVQAALLSKETELDMPASAVAGDGGPPVVDLARLGLSSGAAEVAAGAEAAAQTRFLEDLVARLSQELAARLAAEGPVTAHSMLQEAVSAAAAAAGGAAADVPLPPWIKDSRYLNPLLASYDARLAAAQAEAAGRAQAAKDIQAQVNALVSENDTLHEQLAQATARLASAAAASRAGAAASSDAEKARLQERLELLETENDLLLAQQGELEEEIQRLGKLLLDKDTQVVQLQAAAAAAASSVSSLQAQLLSVEQDRAGSSELQDKVQDLTTQLEAASARAAAAVAAAEAAAAAQATAQRDLLAAQATTRSVQSLQADLARARSAHEAAAGEAGSLRVEADSLRKALRAMEARLSEYQAKDTEVYLRIKAAMELAEEARLERDAANSTTTTLKQQLEATQARLADATRQLLGGSAADGGLGAAELRQKLAAAERDATQANKALREAEAKVAELQASSAKLVRDKTSLAAELTTLREELGCCCCGAGGSLPSRSPVPSPAGTPGRMRAEMTERLQDAQRQRDDVAQRLDSYRRAAARAEKDWELERNTLHAEVQRLSRKVAAAEAAATAAAAAAAESRQAAAAAEAELQTLRNAAARAESELRAQLSDCRAARDAEVAGLAVKLEQALSACDKAVAEAEHMLAGKDGLLAEWKKEAQLVSNRLELALQQQAAEREELQGQLQALGQQLEDTRQHAEFLQLELEAARVSCTEGDLMLQEAEGRLAAAQTAAAAAQEQALQEANGLQSQLERAHMDKLKAERQRDNLAAKLERVLGSAGASAGAGVRHAGLAEAAEQQAQQQQ